MNNYAIQVLQKEAYLIEKCLAEWELLKYKEARFERTKKLNELKQAIKNLTK